MKVIIQNDLFTRGEKSFKNSGLEFLKFDLVEEDKMIRAQQDSGAKCFIIGAERYPESFYHSVLPGSLIIRFGVGYDAVPITLCQERRILVAYTPGALDQSVAEHTIALMLSCARNIPQADRQVRNRLWGMSSGIELKGKTLAIIGLGKIGRETAGIAKYGFAMKINAFDIFPVLDGKFSSLIDFYTTDFRRVVANADFISLHLRVTKETERFIDRSKLIFMKREAILINTARGKLVNEIDLYDALQEGIIAGAALDVFHNEPYVPDAGKDLRELSNIILTPHIASNTDASNWRTAKLCVKNAINFYQNNFDEIYFVPEIGNIRLPHQFTDNEIFRGHRTRKPRNGKGEYPKTSK